MSNFWYLFRAIFWSEKQFSFFLLLWYPWASAFFFSSYCVFSGLHHDFYHQIQNQPSHLTISPSKGYYFESSDRVLELLKSDLTTGQASPSIISQGILQANSRAVGILLKGLDSDFAGDPRKFLDSSRPIYPIQISESLAQNMQLYEKSTATLITAEGSHHDVFIHTIFNDFGWPDQKYAINLPLEIAQEIILGEKLFNRVDVKLHDFRALSTAQTQVSTTLSNLQIHMESWEDRFSETLVLFDAEKKIHLYFLALMCAFSGLSIYSSFYLIFLRKRSSLMNLVKLGMSSTQMGRFIFGSCQIILIASLFIGFLFAKLIQTLIQIYPIPLPQSLFYSPHIPFYWQWNFFGLVCVFLYLASLIAMGRSYQQVIRG